MDSASLTIWIIAIVIVAVIAVNVGRKARQNRRGSNQPDDKE